MSFSAARATSEPETHDPPDEAPARLGIAHEAASTEPAPRHPPGSTPIVEPKPVGSGPLATPTELAPLWSRVIRGATSSPIMRAILMNSALAGIEGGTATIVAPPRYASGAPKWLTQIAELIGREHGSSVRVAVRSAGAAEPVATTAADPAAAGQPTEPSPSAQAPASLPRGGSLNATDHPLVKQALELFGGRIVDVQPRKPS